MTQPARRVMILGLDAPIPDRIREYARQGKMPALQSLIERGVYARHCMVPYPTITPPNWTTIVTGAWPGTHGITCFTMHNPGDPLDRIHPAFDTAECRSEYLWTAAERAGKKAIIVNYPTTWPPTVTSGWQIGGAGLSPNEWRYQAAGGHAYDITLGADQVFTTQDLAGGTEVSPAPADGWSGAGPDDLVAPLPLTFRNSRIDVAPVTWQLLLGKQADGSYRAALCRSTDASDVIATLEIGQWTPNLVEEFETADGPRRAVFRCKLIDLSSDGRRVRLYMTPICALDGWSHPESVAGEIESAEGLPMPHPGFSALNLGWIDLDTWLEIQEFAHLWLADAAGHLLSTKDWSLFVFHAHCPDWSYHAFSTKMDPQTESDGETRAAYETAEAGFYESIDRMLARMLAHADDETLIVVVSDHGAKASGAGFDCAGLLAKAGLVAFTEAEGKRRIDWSHTKAAVQRSCYIYVNLKGRDPDGIVEAGEEYEAVRDAVIEALYDYTDPATGTKPILFALRKEDARVLGLYGDTVGDIVWCLRPEYGGQHGNFLPTAEWGIGSIRGLFVMAGPGVKGGATLERNVWLTDVVPTICHLTDWPVPCDAEGAVLYQALDDPDAKSKELDRLRAACRRFEQAFAGEKALTHTYNE